LRQQNAAAVCVRNLRPALSGTVPVPDIAAELKRFRFAEAAALLRPKGADKIGKCK
jgi:hypothetical protein